MGEKREMTEFFAEWFQKHEREMSDTADEIFRHPEVSLQERESSRCLADFLMERGFQITWGLAGLETAFLAEWGAGSPVLGVLAEYDALPGLGQEVSCQYKPTGGAGHGCGHNLLGTACAGAACALKDWMEAQETAGTVRVYGCPAEEIVIGKIEMNRWGIFDGLSAAVTWHPFDRNRVSFDIWQAQDIKNYKFYGTAAHASKFPELGRSALDAAELMTGTRVEIERVTCNKEMKLNRTLAEIFYQAMEQVPVPEYTEEELEFAAQISEAAGLENQGEFFSGLEPLEDEPVRLSIGTDVSDVSHTVPTVMLSAAAMCKGTPLHHWAATAQAGMSIGKKGMLYAANCMALGCAQILREPEVLDQVWKEHRAGSFV